MGVSVHGFTLDLPAAAAQAPANPATGAGSLVTPDDPRYQDLCRVWNGRFRASPDWARVVTTTAEVEAALGEAVRAGKRVAVRSGGHCLEGFVGNPDVEVIIDMAPMNAIAYDPRRNAVMIEPGCQLRQVYKELYWRWGVTVPGGICPSVGAGGHFMGGGYGPLSRRLGIVPDHLYAVEVVTVNRRGEVQTVVATSDAGDPNRELWWAHTGGGGGNFGIVTRYWMRTPGSRGTNPSGFLPKPPNAVLLTRYAIPWASLDQASFTALVRNYVTWFADHSAPGGAEVRLNAEFFGLHTGTSPAILINVTTDPTEPDHQSLVAGFKAAVLDAAGITAAASQREMPWLESTNVLGPGDTGDLVGRRNKTKGTYLRSTYTDAQLAVAYRYLTATDLRAPMAGLLFGGFGGRANAVHPDATATPQRDSCIKVLHTVHWDNPAEDDRHMSWIRGFYQEMHADTGGVPVLDTNTDGSYINYCDVDLTDPAWNTSGVPWHDLYYKHSYPRLQAVKARWDPRNVFRHQMSIQAP